MDVCPTRAIKSPGVIDVNRYIDFLTCKPGMVQRELHEVMANRIVSRDRCQEVCPYNIRPRIVQKRLPRLDPRYRDSLALIPLLRLCEEEFIRYYRDCDLIDNSLTSLRRNVVTALGNLMDPVALDELEKISDDNPIVLDL